MKQLVHDVKTCDTCEQIIDARNVTQFYEDNFDFARSMPWEDFLLDDGGVRVNLELRKILYDAEIDYHSPATFFSQSGTQACVNFAVY